ncbi:OmpA family protein [Devosia sp. YIM 151766]|uniref:OmpA family protein n=1 Tax=Devosia sp. YIM 151766 TaxID=3017325 RepID=UPI00255C2C1A|nr:OmpA family protein [Devosia sp. YIM 151766]WIY53971.1 OmpA family protein [Devosia sp. YIM 151766]
MIRDLVKWVAPGVVTMLGGTMAALAMPMPVPVTPISIHLNILVEPGAISHSSSTANARQHEQLVAQSGSIVELPPPRRDDNSTSTSPQADDMRPETSQADVPAEAPMPAFDSAYRFAATRAADGVIVLDGQVPASATATYLASLAGAEAEALIVAPGAPADFASNAQAGMRALLQLHEGRLAFASGTWRLTGTAASAAEKAAIEAGFAALPGWFTALTVASEPLLCQERLAELSAHNAILFQSGNAIIAPSANAELDRFAAALALCPETLVYVEGHTDSDGDDRLNLALSVARAEAVVKALIERGVSFTRLYAVGYGESQPIADNASAEGKRQNRRIVVNVRNADD